MSLAIHVSQYREHYEREAHKISHYVAALFGRYATPEVDTWRWLKMAGLDTDRVLSALDGYRRSNTSKPTFKQIDHAVNFRLRGWKTGMRTGQAWLERARHHLHAARREHLDAGDVEAYAIDVQSIKFLDVFIELLERDALKQKRKRRADLAEHNATHKAPNDVGSIFFRPPADREAVLAGMSASWKDAVAEFKQAA